MKIKPREDSWREISKDYLPEIDPFSQGLSEEIVQILDRTGFAPPVSLLEAGCGSGHISALLTQTGYRADLLDFEALALDKARETYKLAFGAKKTNTKFIQGDLLDLKKSLGTRRFDIVWNSGVLEHFSHDQVKTALLEMKTVARRAILVIVPNPVSLFYLLYREKMLEAQGWNVGVEFLRQDYLQIAQEAGLELIESGYCGRAFTRHFQNLLSIDPETQRLLDRVLDSGQIAAQSLYLQYFLWSAAPKRKQIEDDDRPAAEASPPTAPVAHEQVLLDRTYYMDALGMANGSIAHQRKMLDEEVTRNQRLTAEIEQLRQQLLQTQSRLGEIDQLNAQQAAQNQKMESTVVSANHLLEEKQSLIHSQNARLEEKSYHVGQLQEVLQRAENRIEGLIARVEKKEGLIEQLNAQIQAHREEQSRLMLSLNEKERQEQSLQARMEENARLLLALEQAASEKTALLEQAYSRHKELESELQALREKLSGETEQRQRLERDVEAGLHQQAAQSAQAQQREELLRHELEQAHGAAVKADEELAALRSAAERSDQELVALRSAAERTDQELAVLRSAAERSDEELAALRSAAERSDEELTALRIAAEKSAQELVASVAEARDHERRALTLQEQNHEKDRMLAQVREQLVDLKQAADDARDRQAATSQELARLTGQYEELQRTLQSRQEELKKTREQHEEKVALLLDELKELQDANKKQTVRIREIEREIDDLDQVIIARDAMVENLEKTIEELKQSQIEQEKRNCELVEAKNCEIMESEKKLAQTEAAMAELREELEGHLRQALDAHRQLNGLLAQMEIDAKGLAGQLNHFCGLRRFLIAHYVDLFNTYLLHGPYKARLAFFGKALKKMAGGGNGALGKENSLVVPLQLTGRVCQQLQIAGQLTRSLETVFDRTLAPGRTDASPTHGDQRARAIMRPLPTRLPAKLPRRPFGRRKVAYLTNQLVDWNDYRPRFGGGERYAVELASLLRDLGLEVHFFQPAHKPHECTYEGFPVTCFPLGEFYSEFHYGVCNRFAELAVDYDHVIHNAPEYTSGLVRQDALMICHGIWFDHDNYASAKFRTPEWYQHLGRTFSNPRMIVSVDTNSINYIRALWPELADGMRFIPNFYDENDFYPDHSQRDPDRLTILFPRRSQINRGSRILEGIINRVPHDVHFCWVGEGDPEDTQMIRDLCKRDKRLTFHTAEFSEMPMWYRRADITVIPTIACEGTSLSCLEALASGSATISTNVGGLSDLVQTDNNGLLVDPRPEAIAEAINRLIEDPAERKRLEEVGPISARAFELKRWRQRWAGILADQGLAPIEAFEKAGLKPHEHASDVFDVASKARHLNLKDKRVVILNKNGIHGGVESVIALESKMLAAPVVVTGGHDSPGTCPFEYTRADSYEELIEVLSQYDIVLCHWLPDWAVQAVGDSGLPSVEFVHRTDTAECDKKIPTRVVAHSVFLAEYIRETHGCDCDVVELPIKTDLFLPPAKLGDCVGAVTSYYDIKGLDVFLRAWALLKKEFANVPVRFYGAGPDRDKLVNLAAELGVKAQFLDPVKEPWKVLGEFRCFVLPSRMEGLPMASLEALSMDIPVVASDIDGIVEFNSMAELRGLDPPFQTFPSEDYQAMAQVLRKVLRQKKRPGTHAYIDRQYGLANHARKLTEVLTTALIRGGNAPCSLKLLKTWLDERNLGTPAEICGTYFIQVADQVERLYPQLPDDLRQTEIHHNLFPGFTIELPLRTAALELRLESDTDAILGWQIDWLDRQCAVLGYSADSTRLLVGKEHGCLTKQIPAGACYANVTVRPIPDLFMRLQSFKLRAFELREAAELESMEVSE